MFAVYHILKIDDLHFAIATVQNGIFILNQSGNIIRHINIQNGLSSNTVYYLFSRQSKRLWAGHSKGIPALKFFRPSIHLDKNNGIEGTLKMATVFN
ncbi:MAG: hypothetical protein HC831_04410, partial [Chloroflexia bacterium]|nr:hypothetical protein [Chloroflexia bacterium]